MIGQVLFLSVALLLVRGSEASSSSWSGNSWSSSSCYNCTTTSSGSLFWLGFLAVAGIGSGIWMYRRHQRNQQFNNASLPTTHVTHQQPVQMQQQPTHGYAQNNNLPMQPLAMPIVNYCSSCNNKLTPGFPMCGSCGTNNSNRAANNNNYNNNQYNAQPVQPVYAQPIAQPYVQQAQPYGQQAQPYEEAAPVAPPTYI